MGSMMQKSLVSQGHGRFRLFCSLNMREFSHMTRTAGLQASGNAMKGTFLCYMICSLKESIDLCPLRTSVSVRVIGT